MNAAPTISSTDEIKNLVSNALDTALAMGATSASAEISDESGRCITVRNQQTESIEYTRDRSFGITVYIGQSRATASSGDLKPETIRRTIKAAVDMAKYTAADDCAGLPDKETLCTHPKNLDLCHPWDISIDEMAALAAEGEKAARAVSPRVTNSDGASVNSSVGSFVLGNSEGFLAGYPFSNHSMDVSVIAENTEGMQNGAWFSMGVSPSDLLSAEVIGRKAGERALRALSPRSIRTQVCPVIFEAPAARGLFSAFASAAAGANIYRDRSFLKGKLHQPIFPSTLTIIENPFIRAAYGSAPFDDEGVLPSERMVVNQGELSGLFLTTYSARKLGMKSTGNAGGIFNLLFRTAPEATEKDLHSLLKRMGRGFLVTEMMGQGVNLTTGDFSKGASGFWVEDGKIAYPVDGVTIAGNLREIYRNFQAMSEDYDLNGSVRCGSTLIGSMTLAGS